MTSGNGNDLGTVPLPLSLVWSEETFAKLLHERMIKTEEGRRGVRAEAEATQARHREAVAERAWWTRQLAWCLDEQRRQAWRVSSLLILKEMETTIREVLVRATTHD